MNSFPTGRALRLAVGIATYKRAPILAETLAEIAAQSRRANRVIIACSSEADIAGITLPANASVHYCDSPSLTAKRNLIMAEAGDCDVVLFLDDDFLMQGDYIAVTEAAFAADPSLMVTTGTVLADGINGPGLTPSQARAILADPDEPVVPGGAAPTFAGYGCNMAVRLDVARERGLVFDERLPLYSWQEDVDFTRRLGVHGKIVQLAGARGVHLGTKVGRGVGSRLGYSQVANPLYLARSSRGTTYPYGYALTRISRNMAANLVKSLRPEPYVDRRGRLRGNLIALKDLATGAMSPERATRL